ncbi:MAG: hypothetical protein HY897_12335 [Deltaproteobacteria bacterium]|nr:hypothetical protein [Deltaproteobacteria bacterium]
MILPVISVAQPAQKPLPTLLVFDIVPEKGVERNESNLLTEIVLDKITWLNTYNTIGQKDLSKLLSWEQSKQLQGCTDTSCLIQIAGAMGADYYVEGSVGVMGDSYILTLKLIDTASITVLDRTTQKVPKDENKIVEAVERIIDKIMAGHGRKLRADAKKGPHKETSPERPNMLVFDIVPEKGVNRNESNLLTELVIDRVSKIGKYTVIGQKDLEKMLFWEQNKQLQGCTDTSCMVKIANSMAAEQYIEGSIGVMGDNYIISMKLVDARNVSVLQRSTFKVVRNENAIVESVDRTIGMILFRRANKESVKKLAPVAPRIPAPAPPPQEEPKPSQAMQAPVAQTAEPKPWVAEEPMSHAQSGISESVASKPGDSMATWGKVGTFGGIGVMALGGVFTYMALRSADAYRTAVDVASIESADSDRNTYNMVAIGSYVTGGLLTTTGAILWYLSRGDQTSVSLDVVPAHGGYELRVGGSW